jgi:pSer/pThr/pTyr-binding forkhead associated (FHA) protein
MAYGRIDIYWPDGPIESYQVDKSSIAVGRSTGNDIVLETNAVSRYHVSFSRRDDKVYVEDLDSVNGTYVDSERLKPNEPYLLQGGEEVQLGDIRLIFIPAQDTDSSSTKPVFIEESLLETKRIELSQPSFRIELDPPLQPVTPGAYIQANLTIRNTAAKLEHFTVEVEGLPQEWVRLDRNQMEIDPGDYGAAIISFKPLRRSESTPGDYNIIVRVKADNGENINAVMKLTVRSYSGYGMVLAKQRVLPGEPFELHVHNQGSAPLTLDFSGATPDGGMTFNIQPTLATLRAGEHRTIRGTIQFTNRPLVGATRERRFDLLARSQDASGFLAAVEGVIMQKPLLPTWVPTVFIPLILLLIIGGAILVFSVLGRPRPPVISALSVASNNILVGESAQIQWASTDTGAMTVSIDGAAPVTVDPKTGTYQQVMNDAGEHIFTIEFRNGNEKVVREVRVTVNKALKINAFTVSPNPLLRNVKQDVTVTWDVEGAASVKFVGIEALTGKPDDNNQPSTGNMVLNGTPRDTVSLKLIAKDAAGKQLDQSVQVEIKNPVCLVAGDKADIYGGPGSVYAVINTYTINTEVTPDGRDQSGKWLHLVPSPDLQAWVQASDVKCTDFTPDALTAILSVPPTPTASPIPPTPTLTPLPPTATPTPTPVATIGGDIF